MQSYNRFGSPILFFLPQLPQKFGKQLYKGCNTLAILDTPEDGATAVPRHYNREELSEMFVLEEDGVCESYSLLRQASSSSSAGSSSATEIEKKCSIGKKHEGILGISLRCDAYRTEGGGGSEETQEERQGES